MGLPTASSFGDQFDVVVVGAGNAALCAALSAQEVGARVIVLEAASMAERGGNSRYAGAVFRAPHSGLEHVKTALCQEALEVTSKCSMDPYTAEDFHRDLSSTSHGKNDPGLSETLVDNAWDTIMWMKSKGVKWESIFRKYYADVQTDKLINLEKGAPLKAVGDGQGLMSNLFEAVEKTDIVVRYDAPVDELLMAGDSVRGVRVRNPNGFEEIYGTVILASGGFSANAAMKRQYLGEGWDLVPVRGTRYNTGTMLQKAIAAGARPVGHWGAAHASPQDINAPAVGDISKTPIIPRYSYTYGITVNVEGQRFFDEGENDFGKTYAKTGKKIGDQPRAQAWQIFDQKSIKLLQPRYSTGTAIRADSIEELAAKLDINPATLLETAKEFNDACPPSDGFDPYRLDGLRTAASLRPPKSNWAVAIDAAPFVAYGVTTAITFTYGGIASDIRARALNNEGRPMSGLYCTGEIVGGLFYHNYAGGAGLSKGAVFGRIAGQEAAAFAKNSRG